MSLLLGRCKATKPGMGFPLSESSHGNPKRDDMLEYDGDAHLVTVAATGRGKGRSVIVPNALTYPGPMILMDCKSELHQVTARRRRELGHQVVRLSPFQDQSDSFNPFDIFQLAGADLASDAQMLAQLLSLGNGGAKDPFWEIWGTALCSGVIAAVASSRPPQEQNLVEAVKMLTCDDVVYNLAVLLDTKGKQITPLAYREIASFLQLPDITRGGILATAQSYLKPLMSDCVERTLASSSFDLQDIVAGRPVDIYLVVPPDKLRSHRGLIKLWIGALLKAITSRIRIPEQRTVFMLDELGQLEKFHFLEKIVTLCRGYGAQCWMFFQDLGQLQTCYPGSWRTILNNCGVLQAFGFNNRSMAAVWCEFLDTPLAQLRQLESDEQVVLIQDVGELQCRRLDYLRDPQFRGLFDDNGFYGPGDEDSPSR
ncbi:MAG: type IV secretory system conjugative DNA transfer family protein [Planctomycetales bacterium]|nr:type IV secretory system conjugative DNA transfer family protein [Planctomycetales bacterium]